MRSCNSFCLFLVLIAVTFLSYFGFDGCVCIRGFGEQCIVSLFVVSFIFARALAIDWRPQLHALYARRYAKRGGISNLWDGSWAHRVGLRNSSDIPSLKVFRAETLVERFTARLTFWDTRGLWENLFDTEFVRNKVGWRLSILWC